MAQPSLWVTVVPMDFPRTRQHPALAWMARAVKGLAVVTACVTPLAVLAFWSVLTKPAVAADIATSGDLWPLAEAIADTLRHVLRDVLAYL